MKTYSVTHNPSNKEKSKHNVPDDMIIRFNTNKTIYAHESGHSKWSLNTYGFYISEEELSQYKPLYIYTGGSTHDEVYIVSLENVSTKNGWHDYSYLCSAANWTLVYKTEIVENGKSRLFLEIKYGGTKASQKMFINTNEMREYYEKENAKRQAKIVAQNELFNATNNGPLQFETPKRKIVKINKATDHVPNAKEGDVIYAIIKVLNYDGKNVLSTQSLYVNYVDLYLNDLKINTLPMSTFGDVMSKNFVLE